MDDFGVTHGTREPAEVVAVRGELDAYSCTSLESEIDVAVGHSERPVVIDLTHVAFMDSTAIALLLRTRERLAAARRRLVVVGQRPPNGRLFALTAVDQVLELEPNVDDALRLLAG